MKIILIFLSLICFLILLFSTSNAVWNEGVEDEIQEYNSSDYDPWIPADWIKEDWTFGE